jgi:5-methylcytosine-specific restriction endonuclease McrA
VVTVPWVKLDDKLPMSVKVRGLADPEARGDRATAQRNEALGHWTQLLAWVGAERTDGFLTADVAALYGTTASLRRLLRGVFGRSALLHSRGDLCPCLEGRKWPDGAAYAIHDYLDRNPSRAENDVAKAQRRELRDRELREQVRRRDADQCRYCGKAVRWNDRRSPEGGVLDHVRPDIAAGADNLVVACRGCNTRKGKRSPEAAGMRLRPLPGPTTETRPIYDGPTTETRPIYDGPTTDSEPDLKPTTDRTQNRSETGDRSDAGRPPPRADPLSSANGTQTGPWHAQNPTYDGVSEQTRSAGTDGPGRDGTGIPEVVDLASSARLGPPGTRRTPANPNPYLRSALTGPQPEEHAGHPAEDQP